MSVWVGVDPGEKRIGIARSDPLGMLARPDRVLGSYEELVDLLKAWHEEIQGVIVGLPRNMDGSYGPLARRSYELVTRLRAAVDTPILLWDERLTTQQAEKSRPDRNRGTEIDHEAAAILLQSFLDAGTPAVVDPPELEEPSAEAN